MENGLPPLEDATKLLLGRRHKIGVWATILDYNVEPPETFYATAVHRQTVRETDSKMSVRDVSDEIDVFEMFGMVERVDIDDPDLPATTKAYQCVTASPGWLLIEGAVEAFDDWYPLKAE